MSGLMKPISSDCKRGIASPGLASFPSVLPVFRNLDVVHQGFCGGQQVVRCAQHLVVVFHVTFAYQVLAVAQQDGDVFIGVIDGDAGLDAEQVQGGVAGFEEGFGACGDEGGLVVVFSW